MLLLTDKLCGDADFKFQQDLVPPQPVKITNTCFNDHDKMIDQQMSLTTQEFMSYWQKENEKNMHMSRVHTSAHPKRPKVDHFHATLH